MSRNWIFRLEELGQEHNDIVGRKSANLGEMTKMNLPVPPGFALCVEAYQDFMKMTGLVHEIRECISLAGGINEELAQFNELSTRIRHVIHSKVMSEEMEEIILTYYRELCQRSNKPDVAVSVRSAGPMSHPGQYETYLNIIGESEILDKVKKVWASTFNPRSLAFRSQKGIPLDTDPIGVAVLKMVNAGAAGVIFTADPNTGDTSRMIIEANWGLGESVVNGESTPDIYIVNKESLEVEEKKLGPKIRCVVPHESGTTEIDIPPEKRATFCLNEEEIKTLAKFGKILEDHFGVPQDVEWAIDQDAMSPDNVVLLQTRPEVIAQQKTSVDQIVDLMLDHFSGGTKFGDGV
jgi:pyruvate,water dikinase